MTTRHQKMAENYLRFGKEKSAAAEYEEAIIDFSKAIKFNSWLREAYLCRADAYAKLERFALALEDVHELIRLEPNWYYGFYFRSWLYQHHFGEDEQAMRDLNKTIQLASNFAIAWRSRGLLHYKKEAWQDAMIDLSRAISLTPDDDVAYYYRAVLNSEQFGGIHEAYSDFSEVIRIKPDNPNSYNNRGIFLTDRMGEFEDAIADFDKALEQDPEYAYAYNNRANAYRRLGKLKEARKDVRKSLKLDGNNGYAHATLAMIYADEGKYEQFYKHLAFAISKPLPFPLRKKIEIEPTLQERQKDEAFQEILKKSEN